jgi:CBS domain-containing protein
MTLREILAAKGNEVFTIAPDASLRETAQRLVERRVGALVVFEPGHELRADEMRGIISERDLLRTCANQGASLDEVRVADVMSPRVITGSPDDRVEDVMGLMTQRRMRHLPVVSDGRLVGMVSIGDVVKSQHDLLAMENRFMKDYISG